MALYLPTFSHLLIVNKTSLSLSLSSLSVVVFDCKTYYKAVWVEPFVPLLGGVLPNPFSTSSLSACDDTGENLR
jgi:hypothetical protein